MKSLNKKNIFVLGAVVLTVFVLSGCNKKFEETKSQTDNYANEIQGKSEGQQAKNDDFLDSQQELKDRKQQETIASCEEAKKQCGQRMNAIGTEEIKFYTEGGTYLGKVAGSRESAIAEIKKDITKAEKYIKETEKNRVDGEWGSTEVQRAMKNSITLKEEEIEKNESMIKKIEALVKKEIQEKSDLLNDKCKNYQNVCE